MLPLPPALNLKGIEASLEKSKIKNSNGHPRFEIIIFQFRMKIDVRGVVLSLIVKNIIVVHWSACIFYGKTKAVKPIIRKKSAKR